MQCLYVCKNDDGSVIVAPAPDVTPDQLQDGETFKDASEAGQAITALFSDEQHAEPDADEQGGPSDADADNSGEDAMAGGGDEEQGEPAVPDSENDEDEGAAMGAGYKSARRGR